MHLCDTDLWDKIRSDPAPVVLYGMGNGADKLIARLGSMGVSVRGVFASDGFAKGKTFRGMPVETYVQMCARFPDRQILLCFGSRLPEVIDRFLSLDGEEDFRVPDMPVAGEEYFDLPFARSHAKELDAARACFSDESSRALFDGIVEYKLSGRLAPLLRTTFAEEDVFSLFDTERVFTAVDAGAYSGDTARDMIRRFVNIHSLFAIEPDLRTYRKLASFAEGSGGIVHPIRAALHAQSGEGVLHSGANRNSSLVGSSYEAKEESVPLLSLDTLGLCSLDYIKYDVEGVEREALDGSERTLCECRPVIRVAAYHRSEDLFALPLKLSAMLPDYRIYLRRAYSVPAWDMDVIAVPQERIRKEENQNEA